jgi:hypothetical protein
MEINQVRNAFDGLRDIHENRDQYNIEWAFRNAQDQMDTFQRAVDKERLESKCRTCSHSREATDKLKAVMEDSGLVKRKSRWYQSFFHNIYSVLTLAEVAVSFTLVFLMSELSHLGGAMIHSEGFSILFAMTFAFLKVVLERYYVEPRMNAWGWKIYIDSVDRLDHMTTEVIRLVNEEPAALVASQVPLGIMGGMRMALQRQLTAGSQTYEMIEVVK